MCYYIIHILLFYMQLKGKFMFHSYYMIGYKDSLFCAVLY